MLHCDSRLKVEQLNVKYSRGRCFWWSLVYILLIQIVQYTDYKESGRMNIISLYIKSEINILKKVCGTSGSVWSTQDLNKIFCDCVFFLVSSTAVFHFSSLYWQAKTIRLAFEFFMCKDLYNQVLKKTVSNTKMQNAGCGAKKKFLFINKVQVYQEEVCNVFI